MSQTFRWPIVGEFRDREEELRRLEEWWRSPERMPVNLYGRRRVGKSWLFRRLAHDKPAALLVAERLAPGTQLSRFAAELEQWLGLRPEIRDIPELFRLLFRAAAGEKRLAVLDEFPLLLAQSEPEAERQLSAIRAVIEEERDRSKLKLILCGSAISQMEALMSERNPLHGRTVPLELRPLSFEQASAFLKRGMTPAERVELYAICGGMPRYLSELGGGDLRNSVCSRVLDRNGPLWNEPRVVLEQELRQPGSYFSILEQLARTERTVEQIAARAKMDNRAVSRYLATLTELRIVRRKLPVGTPSTARGGHWELLDPFFRFWFRFVFPFQAELEAGLRPEQLWNSVVKRDLGDHVAPVFEDLCRHWTRANHGSLAQLVGAWWGRARDELRRTGERTHEEIDIVGIGGGRVTLVGECRWRSRPMDAGVLADLEQYKLPALRQAGHRIARHPLVLLFSRSGFSAPLQRIAAEREHLKLMGAADL